MEDIKKEKDNALSERDNLSTEYLRATAAKSTIMSEKEDLLIKIDSL